MVMVEKRSETRRRVFKGGTISFGGAAVDCTVRNVSNSGATLDVASLAGIPPSFKLAIRADDFVARCRIVWSKENRIGVAFD